MSSRLRLAVGSKWRTTCILWHPIRNHNVAYAAYRLRHYSSEQPGNDQLRERTAVGPFTWRAALLFVATGAGLYYYFTTEKAKAEERKRRVLADTSLGRPQIGGPFSLVSQNGEVFTDKDLLGKWALVYFGFTNCPDICPDELDKMSAVVRVTDAEYGPVVQPVFISCDPVRDTVGQMRTYISDFHPRMVGLTGSYDDIKAVCKAYRVYFSTPPNAQPGDDYLVDHSIYFYLMDPSGCFVEAFGKSSTVDDVQERIRRTIEEWTSARQ